MFTTFDGTEVFPHIAFDSAGRVRWHAHRDGMEIMVVPEPPVPPALVREFVKAHPMSAFDPGDMSPEEAWSFSIND